MKMSDKSYRYFSELHVNESVDATVLRVVTIYNIVPTFTKVYIKV